MMDVILAPREAGNIDFLDFATFEKFEKYMVGTARLWLNRTAIEDRDQEAVLFVHGAHHGAWCYSAYMQYFDCHRIAAAALDLTGHGGLVQAPDFHTLSVERFAMDVTAAASSLERPVFLVAHSLGALVGAFAAQSLNLTGLGLIAPSPPGNLPNAVPMPLRPTDRSVACPPMEYVKSTFLKNETGWDMGGVHAMLCAESAAMSNQRYGLQISVNPEKVVQRGFCIEAGLEDSLRHPEGQDKAVAEFFSLKYFYLPSTPHCMMIAKGWLESAALILGLISGLSGCGNGD